MYPTSIRTLSNAGAAALVGILIALASAAPARASLNPAGPGNARFRCCFRYEVQEIGSFGLSFNAGSPVQQGTWSGAWDWTTLGIYTFLEGPHQKGELYTLAAVERDSLAEADVVKDLVWNEGTNSYVWVPDNTNHTYGDCERKVELPYQRPGVLGGANIFTFGAIKAVGPDRPQGSFGCDPYGVTPGSAGSGVPAAFKPFYGDPFGNTEVPHPAYASFASGEAVHTLTCSFSGFGPYMPANIATGKAAKQMIIDVQYFPQRELARYAAALKSPSPSGFHFASDETVLPYFISDTGSYPEKPFEPAPKNGCHKGN